jgi:hypothetical protein
MAKETVKVTVSFESTIDLANYPNTVLSAREAVAFDFLEDPVEAMFAYLQDADNVLVINAESVMDEKNDTALLAERLSKEL